MKSKYTKLMDSVSSSSETKEKLKARMVKERNNQKSSFSSSVFGRPRMRIATASLVLIMVCCGLGLGLGLGLRGDGGGGGGGTIAVASIRMSDEPMWGEFDEEGNLVELIDDRWDKSGPWIGLINSTTLLTVCTIKVTMSDGTVSEVPVSLDMISGKEGEFDNETKMYRQKGWTELTITYSGFQIKVKVFVYETDSDLDEVFVIDEEYVESIELVDDRADKEGPRIGMLNTTALIVVSGRIKVYKTDGTTSYVPIKHNMVSGVEGEFDNETKMYRQKGWVELTITYSEKQTTVSVFVYETNQELEEMYDNLAGKAIENIELLDTRAISGGPYIGMLNTAALFIMGGKISVNLSDGTSREVPITESMVSGKEGEFDNSTKRYLKKGWIELTISYKEHQTTVSVFVYETNQELDEMYDNLAGKTIESIELVDTRANPGGPYIGMLNTTALFIMGGKIQANLSDGTSSEVSLAADMVSGKEGEFDNSTKRYLKKGWIELTISYKEHKTTVSVFVYETNQELEEMYANL